MQFRVCISCYFTSEYFTCESWIIESIGFHILISSANHLSYYNGTQCRGLKENNRFFSTDNLIAMNQKLNLRCPIKSKRCVNKQKHPKMHTEQKSNKYQQQTKPIQPLRNINMPMKYKLFYFSSTKCFFFELVVCAFVCFLLSFTFNSTWLAIFFRNRK